MSNDKIFDEEIVTLCVYRLNVNRRRWMYLYSHQTMQSAILVLDLSTLFDWCRQSKEFIVVCLCCCTEETV